MDSATALAGERTADRRFFVFNALLSALVLGFLGWLLVVRSGDGTASSRLDFLPAVNAAFNATAALLLVAGWVAIKNGRTRVHRYLMVAAFTASALFFLSYVVYHFVHGDTKYAGTGPLRAVYLSVLATHVVLSMGVVPMALTALWFAYRRKFASHRRVTRVLLPVWLYVSVTGVVIFFMLRSAGGG